jgi:hypothetical protein
MPGSRAARLVETALRCYPARWRRRHGDEAAELATLLIRDGTPVGSVALSYFLGAARERLTPHAGRRLGTAVGRLCGKVSAVGRLSGKVSTVCALLAVACALGISAGVLTSTVPARAASTARAGDRAHCRPVPVATVRHENPARDRPRLKIREAGESVHDRSC